MLRGYALGRSPGEEAASIERHVDGCGACRELLAELKRGVAQGQDADARARPRDESVRPAGAPSSRRLERPSSRGRRRRQAIVLQPGEQLGRYEIDALIGRGGMGFIYRARDSRLGRQVAIKLLSVADDDPDLANRIARFQREARAAAAVDHPNVIAVYDVDEIDGVPFIAMELLSGQPLSELIHRLEIGRRIRVRWLIEVASALSATHERGILHRDIKPDNVMITREGRAKLLDFGVARRTAGAQHVNLETLTEDGVAPGTPSYMSPEQLRGESLDAHADQFSWGVLAYEVLSGKSPWEGEELCVVLQIAHAEPPPIDPQLDVPKDLEIILRRAMAKDAAARFGSMNEIAAALEPFAAPPTSVPSLSRLREGCGELMRSEPAPAPAGVEPPAAAPARYSPLVEPPWSETTLASAPPPTSTAGVASLAAVDQKAPVRAEARKPVRKVAVATAVMAIAALGAGGAYLRARPVQVAAGAQPHDVAAAGDDTIDALSCHEATLVGDGTSPEMARALGVGACARLALDVGVPWGSDLSGPAVDVATALSPGSVEVKISVAGRAVTVKASAPRDALATAAAALAKQLKRRPFGPDQIRAWGAKDEAGAALIERAFTRRALRLDASADVRRAEESEPASPWSSFMALGDADVGSPAWKEGAQRVLSRIGVLPPARADAMKATLLCKGPPSERSEAHQLFQRASSETAADVAIVAYHVGCLFSNGEFEVGDAILERLWQQSGSRSLAAMSAAIHADTRWDLARRQTLLERVQSVLPESTTWAASIHQLLAQGRIDEARAAFRLGQKLGSGEALLDEDQKLLSARIELEALDPARARAMAWRLQSDPSSKVLADASELVVAAYLLEGQLSKASATAARESEKSLQRGDALSAAALAAHALSWQRWLGKELDASVKVDEIERGVRSSPMRFASVRLVAEAAVVRAGGSVAARANARSTLESIEELAEKTAIGGDAARESMLLATLPLVRVVRGDREAAELWRQRGQATSKARQLVALDAALAFEALKDDTGAEEAYVEALRPGHLESVALPSLVARVRLSALYRRRGRAAEASKLEAVVDRLWSNAEPGLRQAIPQMR